MPGSPHDALFKWTFSQVEHAVGMLKLILPKKLVERVDFATLALCPGSFVDEELAGKHTDLLFSADIAGRRGYIYILVEHQSSVDGLMPLRLLSYMVRIWKAFCADHPEARLLPGIMPVVLHHSATGWTATTAFEDLLDMDAELLADVREHVPRFRFVLEDLSLESDDSLRARTMSALGRLTLWCLRSARVPEELIRGLRFWVGVIHEVGRAPNGAAALGVIWRYVFAVHERIKPDELVELLVEAVGGEEMEALGSVADQLREEGRRVGLQQGMQQGLRAALLKLLRARFGALPEGVVTRVNNADSAELDAWTDLALTAASLADVVRA